MNMKAILVDDEWLALRKLEKMLASYDDIDLIGSYTHSPQALEQISLQQPDVVFLDINMPELNGLQAILRIHEVAPSTAVVFITAYDNHAYEAFELNAFDYIMKPVQHERLAKTIQRLQKHCELLHKANPTPDAPLIFHCMGTMQIQVRNHQPEKLAWRTIKIKELFAYLFHQRGQVVSKAALLELLWPDQSERNGLSSLQTSIYRIRRQLAKYETLNSDTLKSESFISIQYTEYGYVMDMPQVPIDIYEWERKIGLLKPISLQNVSRYSQLIDEYRGHFLGEDNYAWAEIERQRIKAIWIHHVQLLGQFYIGQGMFAESLRIYHKAQQLDPLSTDICLALMKLYDKLNDRASVETQFHVYKNLLYKELAVHPNDKISAWYHEWNLLRNSNVFVLVSKG
ncbi:response regulator [Paenibacillus sedimenti]|uniref:Response regulator n=1 Tax=Paenibacillus sedimenti TaxID=2770274 RepID=A0A926KT07_9BACL|nr:response regulator [Paenibacillus sedimenti]MBD0383612.1 response regulator [Paenibacillus sedimenti]